MTCPTEARWSLTLYVNGASPRSVEAIETVRDLCNKELAEKVDLEVVDVRLQPALVLRDRVLVAPTLVKHLPAPRRQLVGNLTDIDRVRTGLQLDVVEGGGPQTVGH